MFVEAENLELQELLSQLRDTMNSNENEIDTTNKVNTNNSINNSNNYSCNCNNSEEGRSYNENKNNNNNNMNSSNDANTNKYQFSPATRLSTYMESNGNSSSRNETNVYSAMKCNNSPIELSQEIDAYSSIFNNETSFSPIVDPTAGELHDDTNCNTSNALSVFELTPDLFSFSVNQHVPFPDDKSESNDNDCELVTNYSHTIELQLEDSEESNNENSIDKNYNDDLNDFTTTTTITTKREVAATEQECLTQDFHEQEVNTHNKEQSEESSPPSDVESASSFVNNLVKEQFRPKENLSDEQEQEQEERYRDHCSNSLQNMYTNQVVNNRVGNKSSTDNVNSSVKSYTLSQVIINPTTKEKSPVIDRGLYIGNQKNNRNNHNDDDDEDDDIDVTKITLVSETHSPNRISAFSSMHNNSPYHREKFSVNAGRITHLLNNNNSSNNNNNNNGSNYESSRPVISITATLREGDAYSPSNSKLTSQVVKKCNEEQ